MIGFLSTFLLSYLIIGNVYARLSVRQQWAPMAPFFPGIPRPGDIKLPGQGRKSSPENPAVPPPTRNQNCDSEKKCSALSQIVFPTDCKQTQQNNHITAALKKAAPEGKVYISMDDSCGVFLWIVELRPDQIHQISKLSNVEYIEVNRPLDNVETPDQVSNLDSEDSIEMVSLKNPSDDNQEMISEEETNDTQLSQMMKDQSAEEPFGVEATTDSKNEIASMSPISGETEGSTFDLSSRSVVHRNQKSKRKLEIEKRSSIIIKQSDAPAHLAFISSPGLRAHSRDETYLYLAGPYEPISIYAVDTGVEAQHEEFLARGVIKDWIFAPDIGPDKQRKTDYNGHGSCTMSVICGRYYGVFKDPHLNPVVILPTSGSLLAGLRTLINHLIKRVYKGDTPVRGYTVVYIPLIVNHRVSDQYKQRLIKLLGILIRVFKAVIVTAAGNKGQKDISDYPSLLADQLPIITVGSVSLFDAKRSSISQGGPLLTVNAPGAVQCAKAEAGSHSKVDEGTSNSAAITTGLAAALLANKQVGDLLRQSPLGVVEAVKACIVELAKARDGVIKSIWNGIDPTKPNENYGWPPKNLQCFRGGAVSLDNSESSEAGNVL